MSTAATVSKTCFVIAPIGEPGSDTRKRSDQVFRHVIEPCAAECGYVAVRADQLGEPGIITNQVIQHLIDDPLVIADLTERNPNVFYELAIRHMLRRPLVQLIRRGEAIPFDVAAMRVIHVDHQDLDSVAEAKGEIIKQIRVIEREPAKVQSPISAAIDLTALKRSERPEDQMLADIASSLAELRTAVGQLAHAQANAAWLGSGSLGSLYVDPWVVGAEPQYVDVGGNIVTLPRKRAKAARVVIPDDPCPCKSGKVYRECHGADTDK